jgi:CO/xanthine dehydrogenase FAD-binding subunit
MHLSMREEASALSGLGRSPGSRIDAWCRRLPFSLRKVANRRLPDHSGATAPDFHRLPCRPGRRPLLFERFSQRPCTAVGTYRERPKDRAPVLYFEPNFVDEALVLLDRFGPRARLLAGGTRLGFALRRSTEGVEALVNLKRISEMSAIEDRGQALAIGALVTAATLARDPIVKRCAPMLAAAAASMGAPQLRTTATLGGNVCSGDPLSDLAVALLAYDAQCVLARPDEPIRAVELEMLLGATPVLDVSTLLTGVSIPLGWHKASFQKMTTRRGLEMALVSAAFCARIDEGRISKARLAFGGAAPACIRTPAAEERIEGHPYSRERARDAAEAAAAAVMPPGDERASVAYRRHLVRTLAERTIKAAFASADGVAR